MGGVNISINIISVNIGGGGIIIVNYSRERHHRA